MTYSCRGINTTIFIIAVQWQQNVEKLMSHVRCGSKNMCIHVAVACVQPGNTASNVTHWTKETGVGSQSLHVTINDLCYLETVSLILKTQKLFLLCIDLLCWLETPEPVVVLCVLKPSGIKSTAEKFLFFSDFRYNAKRRHWRRTKLGL